MATIYLDLDGTLVDCRLRHYRLYSRICTKLGLRALPSQRYWALRRKGASSASLVRDASDDGGSRFTEMWMRDIESPEYVSMDRPFPAVIQTLKRLKGKHRLVLVTLRHREGVLLRQLDDLGLRRLFDAVRCPNGRPVESKADLVRGESNNGRAVFVGDSDADVAAARELGSVAICVSSGVRGPGYLEEIGADYLIRGIGALPRLLDDIAA